MVEVLYSLGDLISVVEDLVSQEFLVGVLSFNTSCLVLTSFYACVAVSTCVQS